MKQSREYNWEALLRPVDLQSYAGLIAIFFFFFMVKNSTLQSTLALLSAQLFYNERAHVGHGDPTLSTVTPFTLG